MDKGSNGTTNGQDTPKRKQGRGYRMTELPELSVWHLADAEQRRKVARWAVQSVRIPPAYEEDALQEIEFAFRRHRIESRESVKDLGRLMRTTAKRWALYVKRNLCYPVRLNDVQFFDERAYATARVTDSEIDPSIGLFHQDPLDEQLFDEIDEHDPDDDTQAGTIPEHLAELFDRVWESLRKPEQDYFRHIMFGETPQHAGELEHISPATAKSYYEKILARIREYATEMQIQ